MMKMKSLFGAGIVAGALAVSSVAGASVTFDPSSGTGFVGKGDVQVPWGWNNATLQAQAGNVTFSYSQIDSADYDVTCEWDTGTRRVVHHVQTTSHDIGSTVAYDVNKANRTNNKGAVTGFNLTGQLNFVTTDSGDPIPTVGDSCPGNSGLGLVTGVSDPYNVTSTQELDAADAAMSLGPTAIWLNGVSVLP